MERAIRYIRESFFYGRIFATLEGFNGKAWSWREEVAHERKWPDDKTKTVAEAFAEEQPRLPPLPAHPFETDLLLSVSSPKTIYVRFDRNDYSIAPDAVGKSLSLAVSDTQLRIFDGTAPRVTHRRSYDQGRRIEDPSHQEALLALKRKARGGVASARLLSVAPQSEAFLDAAFLKGEHIGSLVQKLTRLLDDYGERRFQAALAEALERGTPRASRWRTCSSGAAAAREAARLCPSTCRAGRTLPISSSSLTREERMTSYHGAAQTIPRNDLAAQLCQIGLLDVAECLEDFVARRLEHRVSQRHLHRHAARQAHSSRRHHRHRGPQLQSP